MKSIGFYIYPGHQALDLAGPFSAFEAASTIAGHPLYSLNVLSRDGGPVVGSGGMSVETSAISGKRLDTLVVAGGNIALMLERSAVQAVRSSAIRSRRVASVCTGAFLLAEAGLLDGRRATTHWRRAREFQARYKAVKVETDRIFIADEHVWTSAGITAGIDLALALIEEDHGVDLAREVARELVIYHRRSGGQSQFSTMSHMAPESDRIRIALSFAQAHLPESLPVERLASEAALSVRQFERVFKQQTGETPAKAIERLRVEAARIRLQEGSESVAQIARAVGFNDPERMRRAFIHLYGLPPQSIRRAALHGSSSDEND
ncbi:GlxA family transcriptional regulator [Carnimonas bestiolae]|uniref:GlxA family transcriptional regulator n=1 Tax=Carnimonas bestiolae TaxID=3402172 RepID=UPI003EDC06B5